MNPAMRSLVARSFWVRFGGAWFGVGVIFLSTIVVIAAARWQPAQRRTAQGRVTGKFNERSELFPSVAFEYAGPGGAMLTARREMAPMAWEALQVGDVIEVRYPLRRPERVGIDGGIGDALLFILLGGLGAFLTLVGGWVLKVELARIRQAAGSSRG